MQKWNRFQYLPVRPLGKDGRMVTGSSEHIRLSRTAAAEGMVLLKNEHQLLPLQKGCQALSALFPIAGARAANTAKKKTIATIVTTTKGKNLNFKFS